MRLLKNKEVRGALLWQLLSVPGLWLCSRIRRVLSQ